MDSMITFRMINQYIHYYAHIWVLFCNATNSTSMDTSNPIQFVINDIRYLTCIHISNPQTMDRNAQSSFEHIFSSGDGPEIKQMKEFITTILHAINVMSIMKTL